ncbi:MAG: DMT family transporter [Kiloniellaceae bacterium]
MSGVRWAIAASLATAATHAAMRGVELHPFLVAFWRNALCLALVLPAAVWWRSWTNLPGALPRHSLRGLVNAAARGLLIAGLGRLPFTEATALTFATPVFVLIGGMVFLKERPGPAAALSAALGFAGVLIIAPPGPGWRSSGGALVLASAVFFAASMLIGRSQTRYADNLSILFYLYLMLTLFTAPLAATEWQWPDGTAFAGLAAVALCGVVAHFCAIIALRRAEAARIAPFDYLRLVWAAIIGLALFGEPPSARALTGGALITAAALLALHRGPLRRAS